MGTITARKQRSQQQIFEDLKELIEAAQEDFYGDAEDWQPAYMGVAPDCNSVIISYDINQIPVDWFLEQAARPAEDTAMQYVDLRM